MPARKSIPRSSAWARLRIWVTCRRTSGPAVQPLSRSGRLARLLETLWAFLEQNGSYRMAARTCHAHVNTVRYRIQQAERLLGRDLSQAAYRTELLLAMQVLRLAAEGRSESGPS